MTDRLAIIAGAGRLPVALAQANPDAYVVSFRGMPTDVAGAQEYMFERLGELFADLEQNGVSSVVMAGAMSRPQLDPAAMDEFTAALAPDLLTHMKQGDDGLLRFVVGMFEDQGIKVRGAAEVLSDLTLEVGNDLGDVPPSFEQDLAKADDLLRTLASSDVGQGVVVEQGQVLGMETLQGTNALLKFVADTPDGLRRSGGIFVKRPKQGQDLRVDMPAIGPETIEHVARAKLDAIVISPRAVIVIDKTRVFERAGELGIALVVRDPQ
jgi:hypothetical protein